MTTPQVTALEPCPFCGGKAVDRREIDGFPMIYCDSDKCFGPQTTARTFEDALVQWNTRALAQPAPEAKVREAVTSEMVTAAMRAFELMSSVLRYREKDKWHACDIMGMRDALVAALSLPHGAGEADHQALIRAERDGYNKGIRDMAQGCPVCREAALPKEKRS